MLTIGQHHDVTFKVNVMGTQAEPKARLVLGTHPELSFPAVKTGDIWMATLRIPSDMEAGSYPMRVEVVVNNRHFTPLTKMVELVSVEQPAPVEASQPEPEQTAEPVEPVEAAPAEVSTDEIPFVAAVEPQDEAQPQAAAPRISIIQMVADREKKELPVAEEAPTKMELPAFVAAPIGIKPVVVPAAPELAALQKVAEVPAPKRFAPVVTPLPKPEDVKPAPIKVKLGDIIKVAENIEPKNPPQPRKKTKPVVELKAELPIKLVKGDIIYE